VNITPQTRNWLRQSAALDGAVVSQTLLNLLERVEALEAAQPHDILLIGGPLTPEAATVATVATDEDLYQIAYSMPLPTEQGRHRRCYDLGRQHGGAQPPAAQPAPPAPEPEEVAELVAALKADAECVAAERYDLCNLTADQMHRAATLLQQPSAPAPAVVPVNDWQPIDTAAPAGGLVERVAKAIHSSICADPNLYMHEARAAIREVAAWLRSELNLSVADLLLEQEANR